MSHGYPITRIPATYANDEEARNPTRSEHIYYGDFDGVGDLVELALGYDHPMRMHLLHVNRMAIRYARALQLEEDDQSVFIRAALLHDLGKIEVPPRILRKPSRLTEPEYALVKEHARLGEEMLIRRKGFEMVASIAGQHHERIDGNGYPRGLRGEGIHKLARALSVLDAFSAMTLDRSYHRREPVHVALDELERCAGTQFDPYYVKSFVAMQRAREIKP